MPKKTIKLKEEITIPEGIEISIEKNIVKVKGPKGELFREITDPRLKFAKKENKLIIEATTTRKPSKREKKVLGTCVAHIKNLIKGASDKFVYKLKVCSTHFPITVSLDKDSVVIKNFLGEKVPRKAKVLPDVYVKVEGDVVLVESSDKEKAGQTASNIESAAKIKGRDLRRFSDGIWIFCKGGKDIK